MIFSVLIYEPLARSCVCCQIHLLVDVLVPIEANWQSFCGLGFWMPMLFFP